MSTTTTTSVDGAEVLNELESLLRSTDSPRVGAATRSTILHLAGRTDALTIPFDQPPQTNTADSTIEPHDLFIILKATDALALHHRRPNPPNELSTAHSYFWVNDTETLKQIDIPQDENARSPPFEGRDRFWRNVLPLFNGGSWFVCPREKTPFASSDPVLVPEETYAEIVPGRFARI